jgi:hypothetical protein
MPLSIWPPSRYSQVTYSSVLARPSEHSRAVFFREFLIRSECAQSSSFPYIHAGILAHKYAPPSLATSKFLAGLVLEIFLSLAATSWAAGVFEFGTLSGWASPRMARKFAPNPSVDAGAKKIECN